MAALSELAYCITGAEGLGVFVWLCFPGLTPDEIDAGPCEDTHTPYAEVETSPAALSGVATTGLLFNPSVRKLSAVTLICVSL